MLYVYGCENGAKDQLNNKGIPYYFYRLGKKQSGMPERTFPVYIDTKRTAMQGNGGMNELNC